MTTAIATFEDFKAHVEAVQARPGYANPFAFGIGVATVSPSGKILDTAYPVVNREENNGFVVALADILGHSSGTKTYELDAATLDRTLANFAWTEGDGKVHLNVEAMKAARPPDFSTETDRCATSPPTVSKTASQSFTTLVKSTEL